MTTTKTFSNRHLAGEYKNTAIDGKKAISNRLTSICGKYYTIITAEKTKIELIGKRAFDKWASSNGYVCDF